MAAQLPAQLDPDERFTAAEKFRYAKRAIRLIVGFKGEGIATKSLSADRRFIRSFEYSVCDGALILDQDVADNLPGDPISRFEMVQDRVFNGEQIEVCLIEVKSATWYFRISGHGMSRIAAMDIFLTEEQARVAGAVVFVSVAQPLYVAFIPRSYFDGRDDHIKVGLVFPANTNLSPISPSLAQFVMRSSDLPAMQARFLRHVQDPANNPLINPFSGLRIANDVPTPIVDASMVVGDPASGEVIIRRQLRKAFNLYETTGLTPNIPLFTPITTDIRFDYEARDGTSATVFVEIKSQAISAIVTRPFSVSFKHVQIQRSGRGIFNARAKWDFILSTVEGDTGTGYLLFKDEIPTDVWNSQPTLGTSKRITITIQDPNFLENRKINLASSNERLVKDFGHILRYGTKTPAQHLLQAGEVPPRKAQLTDDDILARTGPVPKSLISQAIPEEGDPNYDYEFPDPFGSYASRDVDRRELYVDRTTAETVGVIILDLIGRCRATGQGCVLDLGFSHPLGQIGFVQHHWTEEDKQKYDRFNIPPRWYGKEASDTKVLTIIVSHTEWADGLLPTEFTPGQIKLHREASKVNQKRSLVYGMMFYRETQKYSQEGFLFPSECLPVAHLGQFRYDPTTRMALFLENSTAVERFAVTKAKLHRQLLNFFLHDDVRHGHEVMHDEGDVWAVSEHYMRTIGECKVAQEEKRAKKQL